MTPVQGTNRVRIALVNHEVRMGGAEVAALRLVDALGHHHRFDAFVPEDGPFPAGLRDREVGVHILPVPPRTLAARRGDSLRFLGTFVREAAIWPAALQSLARELRSFDLVVTGSTKAHVYGGVAARMAGRPLIWWLHDVVDATTFGRVSRGIVRRAARFLPHRIVAVSQASASSLGFREDDPRLRVVYNGIRPSHGIGREPEARDPGPLRIGWVGRLVPSKGPDAFVRMASRVRSRVPSAEFVLVGGEDVRDPGYALDVRQMAKDLGIGDRVEFLEYQEDLNPVFDRLSVLAFTSTTSDSLPTVILEAMASGVPVVGFSVGGVGEIIEDGRSGHVVPPGDVLALADRVEALLKNPEERRAMGSRGRQRVEEIFEWDRWASAWDREIVHLMGSDRKP
jgi:glycosyltransferase involved in cell wall biosynthesis